MEHSVITKRDGFYCGFPILDHLPDGRLTVAFSVSHARDHHVVGDWTVLASTDEGLTWAETDDPTVPQSWPGNTQRERSDRFAGVVGDGTYLCAGTLGWEVLPAGQRGDAERRGLRVMRHPWDGDSIAVTENKLSHISHINPVWLVAISNGTTQCSRIAEYSGYHEC